MPKYVEPAIDLHSFNCPRCGAFADQTWYRTCADPVANKGIAPLIREDAIKIFQTQIDELRSDEEKKIAQLVRFQNRAIQALKGDTHIVIADNVRTRQLVENIHISRCFSCDEISIWLSEKLLHPVSSKEFTPNIDLDQDIKNDFIEAASIASLSPRGAAALLRLCVQKLCLQIGENGKNINTDIASLVKKGLNVKVQKALDIVRVTGNNAVHPGELNFADDKATVMQLFELINIIADAMISQEKRIDSMYENLPENAKKGIADRDKT